MPNINIQIPDEIHRGLKIAAATKDETLKDLITAILDKNAGRRARR